MENNFMNKLKEHAGITHEQAKKVVGYLKEKYNEYNGELHSFFTNEKNSREITNIHITDLPASIVVTEETEEQDTNISSESENIEDGVYMKGNRALHQIEDRLFKAASTNGNGTTIGSLND